MWVWHGVVCVEIGWKVRGKRKGETKKMIFCILNASVHRFQWRIDENGSGTMICGS